MSNRSTTALSKEKKPASNTQSKTIDSLKDSKNGSVSVLSGNFISRFLMLNLTKIITEGNKKPYQFDMLFGLPKKFTYRGDYPKFEAYIEKYKDSYKNNFFGLLLGFHNP